MKEVRVLCVLSSLDVCNGIASYAMNYYRKIDKNKIKIDFLINNDSKSPYVEEIRRNGDKVYIMPIFSIKNILRFLRETKNFFANNKYDIVHCHLANAGMFYLKEAKKSGVNVRILHSHATQSADRVLRRIRNNIMIPISKKYANYYFACSDLAGSYMFNDKKYYLINNAINIEKYKFDNNIRKVKRKELGIEGKFVVGNVGRFSNQKNILFLIDVFDKLQKINKDAMLILIGDGPMETDVKEKVENSNVKDKVLFLKQRTDVNEIYQAMDVFVLPSLYEGLPVVGVEAQCSNLPLIVSDTITTELKLIESTTFISLNESIDEWVKVILNSINYRREKSNIEKNIDKFDIEKEAIKLEELYLNITKDI